MGGASGSAGDVSPKSLKIGTQFNSNPTIILSPVGDFALPTRILVYMQDNRGESKLLTPDVDWTYDAETGVITFTGSKSITGDILVDIPGDAVTHHVRELSVENNKGAITYDLAVDTSKEWILWMIVDPTDDKTLFEEIRDSALIESWWTKGQFLTSDLDSNFSWATHDTVTLSADDNGSYLVVIFEDQNANKKITAAGYVMLSGIEGAAPDADVTVSDTTNLAATIEGQVITLTVKTDGYRLPSTVAITMDGVAVTNYSYDQTTGEIILNVPVTGPVVVTADAEQPVKWLTVTTDNTGAITAKDGTNNVSLDTSKDKVVMLANNVGLDETLISAQGDAMTEDQFLAAIGLTGAASDAYAATLSGVTQGKISWPYVLVLKIVDSKVTMAGVGVNNTPATAGDAAISLSKDTATIAAGATETLTATFNAGTSGLTDTSYAWSSDDTAVATVSGNNATGTVNNVSAGTATITVTVTLSNGSTVAKSCTVTCN